LEDHGHTPTNNAVTQFNSRPHEVAVELGVQTKTTEQYFPGVMFTMLYKVYLTCESVDGILLLYCKRCVVSTYFTGENSPRVPRSRERNDSTPTPVFAVYFQVLLRLPRLLDTSKMHILK